MSLARLFIAAISFLILSGIVAGTAYMRGESGVFPPTNSAPVANNDSYSLHAGRFVGPMTQNDSDPDGDTLTLTITSGPSHGGLGTPTGTYNVWYEPAAGYSGTASFTYQICDPSNACATAIVTITEDNPTPSAE